MASLTDQGYDLSVAYMEVNGNMAKVSSWGTDRADNGYPNSMAEAADLLGQGKYVSEAYAMVGDDRVLTLKVVTPQYISYGWFIADNVTCQKLIQDDGGTTAIDGISLNADTTVRIYTTSGQLIGKAAGKDVKDVLASLSKSIYVIKSQETAKGQKVKN